MQKNTFISHRQYLLGVLRKLKENSYRFFNFALKETNRLVRTKSQSSCYIFINNNYTKVVKSLWRPREIQNRTDVEHRKMKN